MQSYLQNGPCVEGREKAMGEWMVPPDALQTNSIHATANEEAAIQRTTFI